MSFNIFKRKSIPPDIDIKILFKKSGRLNTKGLKFIFDNQDNESFLMSFASTEQHIKDKLADLEFYLDDLSDKYKMKGIWKMPFDTPCGVMPGAVFMKTNDNTPYQELSTIGYDYIHHKLDSLKFVILGWYGGLIKAIELILGEKCDKAFLRQQQDQFCKTMDRLFNLHIIKNMVILNDGYCEMSHLKAKQAKIVRFLITISP